MSYSKLISLCCNCVEQEEEIPVLPLTTNEDNNVFAYTNLMSNNPIKR